MRVPGWLPPVLALACALLLGGVLLALLGQNPVAAAVTMLSGSLGSRAGLAQTAVRMVPLVLVGLGIILAFQARVFNIGAEGQMTVGALAAAAFALALPGWPGPLLLPLTLVVGALAGGVWGGLAGWLKARFGVNEILSTVMLNQIALQLMYFLLRGPMMDPAEVQAGTRLAQSATLPAVVWLPRLVPRTLLHAGVLLLPVLALGVWALLRRTTLGFGLRAVGANPEAARYAGFQVGSTVTAALALSGGLAGLAGAVELLGIHHRAVEGMTGGYGYAGIVAALLGRLSPVGLLPASAAFGALVVGADKMQRVLQVPSALVVALQGLVLCFLVGAEQWRASALARADRDPGSSARDPASGQSDSGAFGSEPASRPPEPAAQAPENPREEAPPGGAAAP